ncbi:hypothetical protein SAMN02745166_03556 [Prosthecobacter debontii]|uniref:Uncharacterized protein n=1 Tax=Prosthecobacter debontii TaxID=48467 RepID=A0A1T4YLK0_9BACT|nr:hypothetical protein [Prosthecobacter debontii]SKB02145.1 hypothetical protein SAMN02745166_03556 [Prosthecobacter debontii]
MSNSKLFPNGEITGLRLEAFGLILVLVAAIWQCFFTDWFARNNQEWIAYTQESVNISSLAAIGNLGEALVIDSQEQRAKWRDDIKSIVSKGVEDTIHEREKRNALKSRQEHSFGIARAILAFVGAGLVVCGKCFIVSHKASMLATIPE